MDKLKIFWKRHVQGEGKYEIHLEYVYPMLLLLFSRSVMSDLCSPRTAAHQAPVLHLWNLLKLMSMAELVMPFQPSRPLLSPLWSHSAIPICAYIWLLDATVISVGYQSLTADTWGHFVAAESHSQPRRGAKNCTLLCFKRTIKSVLHCHLLNLQFVFPLKSPATCHSFPRICQLH